MKEWFKARNIWRGAFEALSDAEAGRLAKALWKYTTTGERADLSGAEKGCYAMLIYTLQQDEAENSHLSDVRKEAGSKGGKQKQANVANAYFATDQEATVANAHNKNKSKNKNILLDDEEDDEDDIIARAKIAGEWKAAFGISITPVLLNKLAGISTEMSVDVVIAAIHESAGHAPGNPADYVATVLSDWQCENVKTVEDASEYTLLRNAANGKVASMNREEALRLLQDFRTRRKTA